MEQRPTYSEVKLHEKELQLIEMTRQLANAQQQLQEKHEQLTSVRRQLQIKESQLTEMQESLSTAQHALNERQHQESPDWVIPRNHIQLTDKLLGKGGWGKVVEGKYCGCAVAVKTIHELILSPHNRRLFGREMKIASRCRHPCLLLLIGATNDDGSPVFITELMETSLRALMEQRSLSSTEISFISLDVALALNYLHQKQPLPIIHRDISSANVLLSRQGNQWRAKVSDYGTANFKQHTMTVAPGNVIYSAPEALSKSQTVKVDVYSFGVLLCEMCVRELPDPERLKQQVVMVTNHELRSLIRKCLQLEPEARPSMEEIITELQPEESSQMVVPADESGQEYQGILFPSDQRNQQTVPFKGGGSQMTVNIHNFEVGSMVEVPVADAGYTRYGVIRWIGNLPSINKLAAGLELEEEESACSDGTFHKERYFTCPRGRGFFVLLENCRPDSRFANSSTTDASLNTEKDFVSMRSPKIEGITLPRTTLEDSYCGPMRGLQGHHFSSYLDATLFSMFAFTSVLDTLLHRRRKDNDLEEYDQVQRVLRNLIVNPLRVYGFVRADRLLALRQLLDRLSSTAGLINEAKDPEEFLNALLQQVLKEDPFLHLKPRDVQEKKCEGAFLYQIITDKDETVKIAQVQTMLEQSFISADLFLSEVPSCLILQMPRLRNRLKVYEMILPNLQLDLTYIVENGACHRNLTCSFTLSESLSGDANSCKSRSKQRERTPNVI
ncbi:uncharacterized protein LOC111335875 [Stylophora pistillata]|uniref:uncharacterized protein LOC111335875 n=1 Tax=Stylophora pistillata TaxID=50429 RepID=UPI000C046537|nr:uncharacterized protein LOC111335875 [Stylophora pistillata]